MSEWMSIGFDPDRMDPVTEPNTRTAISGASGGLERATPSEFGAASGLNDSSKYGIAGAIKRLAARHRTRAVPG